MLGLQDGNIEELKVESDKIEDGIQGS